MELILWRHAEAEDGVPDLGRELTAKGRKQAKAMAAWLDARLPANTRILASPAARTRQTAKALGRPYETLLEIAPGADAAALLAASGWPDAGGSVLIVGHQPTLGEVVARLLTGCEGDFAVKKGAIVWLVGRQGSAGPVVQLKAAMTAALA